ncbi:MAG: hypothetical protein ACREJ3_14595, partial [Polyangiaceae bacterium]
LLAIPRFELNAGIGEGLTVGSSALTAKMILGYVWEHAETATPSAAPSDTGPPTRAFASGSRFLW